MQDGRTVASLDGLRYASHFQPIYSLTHGRVVGHEALLRAATSTGEAVPPPQVFGVDDFPTLFERDWTARLVHIANFTAAALDEQWLFLNVHPALFTHAQSPDAARFLEQFRATLKMPARRLVLEVLESVVSDDRRFEAAVQGARESGCLIALDDFGAGHSNFDRVWRLRPEIVKLDRSLVSRAATDRAVRRMLVQIVSLLHECGALVLMEGIETPAEALLALEANADLVQGYLFARPDASPQPAGHVPAALSQVWDGFESRWRQDQQAAQRLIAPYLRAIQAAGARLSCGHSLETACNAFLSLPGAEVCYLLGADGCQVGSNHWAQGNGPVDGRARAFEPLRESRGARWTRRPYFQRAMEAPGLPQVTRPYRTLHGGHLSVTVSVALAVPGSGTYVVCGDLRWDADV